MGLRRALTESGNVEDEHPAMPRVDIKNLLPHASREAYAVCALVERSGVDFIAVVDEGTSARFRIDVKRLARLRSAMGIPPTVNGNHRFSVTEYRQLSERNLQWPGSAGRPDRATSQCRPGCSAASGVHGNATLAAGTASAAP